MFTDIEGSTMLVRRLGDAWGDVLDRHRQIVRRILADTDGREVGTEGDAFFVTFDDARRAATAALGIHAALAAEVWPQNAPVRLRIGLHTGSVEVRHGNYVGLDVHKAARIAAAAHGGQTLVSETTALLITTDLADHHLYDVGEHRLKDIPGSVRMFQMGPGSFPPPRALDGRVLRLPSRWSHLVGRDLDLARVRKEWEAGARLVSLVGPAGVGKSSLALALGHERADAGDGAAMIPLAAVRDPADVAPEIARVLDAPDSDVVSITGCLGGRRTLLVLDNFEQIRAAGPTVLSLLETAPGLHVLVTSQAPLHVAGERIVYVEPLAVPVSNRYDDVATSPAVAMFLQRALEVDPDFALDLANAAAVAGICRRLDGNPLALELAAARCRSMTPQQLLDRLDSSFTLLRSRRGDDAGDAAAARHASLESALDWTLSLLPDEARALVDGLGVFEGGWTLEMLEQVAAEALADQVTPVDVAWALDDLVDLSVVRRSSEDASRFTWPPALRDLARTRLAATPEQEQRWSRAHAVAYARLAETLTEHHPSVEGDPIRPETANLWRALEWASVADAQLHARLASVTHGMVLSNRAALRPHIVAALATTDDDVLQGRLYSILGYLHHASGEHAPALRAVGDAVDAFMRAGRPVDAARQLVERAYLLCSAHPDDQQADAWLDQADAMLADAGVQDNRAVFMRAQLMVIRHDAHGAAEVLERLSSMLQEAPMTLDDATHHAHLSADCQLLVGDFEAARRTYGVSLRAALEENALAQASIEMQGVAMALGGLGRHREAACVAGAADHVQSELGFTPDYAWWKALIEQLVTRPGIAALGEAGHDEALAAGRALGVDGALDRALELSD